MLDVHGLATMATSPVTATTAAATITATNTATEFNVGDRVTLHSLKTVSLNGRKGEIRKYSSAEERWAVKLDTDTEDDDDGDGKHNNQTTKTTTTTPLLKTVKAQNLKPQDSISLVVIPPKGAIFYKDVPASTYSEWVASREACFAPEQEFCDSQEIHHHTFLLLPDGNRGVLQLETQELFTDDLPLNENMAELGWGKYAEKIQGTVVVSFFYEENNEEIEDPATMLLEPYNVDTVKLLLREMAAVRTPGHPPTAQRIAAGNYMKLPARPAIVLKMR
jgi:hypothetical protein